jgi:threonine/homoserine/homoserine lactone efflux protein
MFCNDFEFKSVCFYDPLRLIHVFYVTGKNPSLFFLSTLSQILHPTHSLVLHPELRLALHPTKTTMVDLVVMVLAASDGRIRDMGFARVYAL